MMPVKASEAELPETSLIICSRNRPQLLWETMQSILAGSEIPTEMIVVDQSDTPDPVLSRFQPEQQCTFRYVWSERKGVSLGRNMAIAMASHPIIIITDDDMLMTASWFDTLVRTLITVGHQSVITGQVLVSELENGNGFAPSIKEDKHSILYEGRVDRDILYTGNMAIYCSAFERLGNFDERLGPGTPYPAAEDNDLGFRLLEANYKIVYEPQAVVYHRTWRSKKESLQLHWNYGFGQGAFYAKYFSLRDTYMIRRMAKDMAKYILRLPYRILFDRAQAHRDLFFVAGLARGALNWFIDHRSRESWSN